MSQILISANETNYRVRELMDLWGVPYKISKHSFEVGDYIVGGYEDNDTIYGSIVVERETVTDLWGKLKSGRGNNQLVDLSYNFRLSVLAIVGYLETDLPVNTGADFSKMINSILAGVVSAAWKKCNQGAEGNIAVINFISEEHFVLFLKELLSWVDKEDPRIPKMERLSRKPEWQYLFWLQSIPGVGELRAKNLMFAFPTPLELVNATKEQIEKVEGFGKKTAQGVYDFFRKPNNPVF